MIIKKVQKTTKKRYEAKTVNKGENEKNNRSTRLCNLL